MKDKTLISGMLAFTFLFTLNIANAVGVELPTVPQPFQNLTYDCMLQFYKVAQPLIPMMTSGNLTLNKDTLGVLLQSDIGKMIDSWGKVPPRILNMNTNWMGAYDECKALDSTKFCASNMKIGGMLPGVYGSCMPDQCTEKDVHTLLQAISTGYLNSFINFPDVGAVSYKMGTSTTCEGPVKYTTGFYVTMVISGIILLLCFLGSVVDGFIEPIMKEVSVDSKPIKKDLDKATAMEKVGNEYVDSVQLQEKNQNGNLQGNGHIEENVDKKKCEKEENLNTNGDINKNKDELQLEEVKLEEKMLVKESKRQLVNDESTFIQILRCFSLQRNTSAIFSTEMPKGAITSINGIRTISMWWIILGHIILQSMGAANDNVNITIAKMITRWSAMPLANPFVSVDTFFFLSGLLVAYLTLKRMDKTNGKLNIPLFYLHRYIRLTPVYIYVILFYANIFKYTLHGPPYWSYENNQNCHKYWWANLLYINNFWKMGEMCVGQSWYIANDWQFYVASPFILYIMYYFDRKFEKSGLRTLAANGIIILMSAICVLINIIMTAVNNYPVLILKGNIPGNPRAEGSKAHDSIYTKPYTRINPYLIGLSLGYLLVRKVEIKIGRFIKLAYFALWVIAILLGYAIVYGTYSEAYQEFTKFLSDGSNVMYSGFHRLIWALAVAWVVYACEKGYGGYINSFLSWGTWVPLSRLTYTAYFVHMMVIDFFYRTMDNPYHYQNDLLAFDYMSILFVSYAMAYILSVAVEYPFIQLEKIIFRVLGLSR